MGSKEEILKNKFQKAPDGEYNPVHEAMDEWAKQEAISYSIFKREYQLIEGMNHTHDVTEKIGMVTWVGASDETIWAAYKQGKQILRWIENPEHPDNMLKQKKI